MALESGNTDLTNPELLNYFSIKLNNKAKIVLFTKSKMKEIIETQLNVSLENCSSYITLVIFEALPFYFENWSEWDRLRAAKEVNVTEEFSRFVNDMKYKIAELRTREQYYLNKFCHAGGVNTYNGIYVLTPALEKHLSAVREKFKQKLPYTLHLKGLPSQLHGILFENLEGEDVKLSINPVRTDLILTPKQILNLPFITIHVDIPDIINIKRLNNFKIERFLCKQSDRWRFPNPDYILEVLNTKSNSHVVSHKFLLVFLNKLIEVISGYKKMLTNLHLPQDLKQIFQEFLKDLEATNLNSETVCEGTDIAYNIGNCMYYNNASKNPVNPENMILRTIMTPIVKFGLTDINLLKNVNPDDDFPYFDFKQLDNSNGTHYQNLTPIQQEFVKKLQHCMVYRCSLCTTVFTSRHMLGAHIISEHPLKETYVCTKCSTSFSFCALLDKRWSHTCTPK